LVIGRRKQKAVGGRQRGGCVGILAQRGETEMGLLAWGNLS